MPDAAEGTGPDARRLRVWRDLLTAQRRITAELERELNDAAGLTLAQYDVLLHLNEAPQRRLRMSDLSGAVLFTTSGLTRLIDRMEAAGLVRRRRSSQDRRVVSAELTDKGARALRSAAGVHLAGVHRLFTGQVSDAELPVLERLFSRLAAGASAATAPTCAPQAGDETGDEEHEHA